MSMLFYGRGHSNHPMLFQHSRKRKFKENSNSKKLLTILLLLLLLKTCPIGNNLTQYSYASSPKLAHSATLLNALTHPHSMSRPSLESDSFSFMPCDHQLYPRSNVEHPPSSLHHMKAGSPRNSEARSKRTQACHTTIEDTYGRGGTNPENWM